MYKLPPSAAMTPDDLALYEALCSDNPRRVEAAIGQLTRRVVPIVEKIAATNKGIQADVNDVVQETVLAVWQQMRIGNFEPRLGVPLSAYLYRIAKNKWLKGGPPSTIPLEKHTEKLPDSLLFEHTLLANLGEAFLRLNEACQQLLRWYYWEDRDLEEIAGKLGTSVDAAKVRKFRCVRRLGQFLKGN